MKFLKKSKKFTSLLGVTLIGGMLSGVVSCNTTSDDSTDTTMYSITWEYDSDAVSVTYEDETTLPTTFAANTELRFTVAANTGYEIDSVRANNSRVPNSNGEYYTTITEDTTITITSTETITSLTIESLPDKLTYLDGETIDLTGMVVSANYGTGRSEAIEYGAGGYSVSPTVFSGGDTSFRVTYSGVSTTVDLESVVEFGVSIDLAGGSLSNSYVSYLEGLELNNYEYSESDGLISFTYYQNLSDEGVTLPTTTGDEPELTRANSSFNGWSGITGTTITNNSGTLNISASWQYDLIIPTKIELIEEDGIPYLVVDGTFGVSGVEIYLYLYEGNSMISLRDSDTTYIGEAGDPFELKFDLRKLSDKGEDYVTKWMDIKFAALIDGGYEYMDIDVSTIEVDLSQVVRYSDDEGGYTYSFQTYTYNGITTLKVMFSYYYLTYTIEGITEQNGTDYLEISGQFAELYYGYTISNTWWVSSEVGPYTATSSEEDGTFTLYVNLDDFTSATNSYAHYSVIDPDGNTIHGGTDENLLVADATNTFPTLESSVGELTNAISFSTSDYTLYVGYAWEGLMLYKGGTLTPYELSLTEEDGVVYLNYQFFYTTSNPAQSAPWLRVQEINGNWAGVYFGRYGTDADISLTTNNGIATYTVAISTNETLLGVATTSGTDYTVHYALSEPDGDNGWSNFDNFTTGKSIEADGYRFELADVTQVDWLNTCLKVTRIS